MIFRMGKFFGCIDPWVFVFFVFGGLFAISGVWIFGFQSIQTLAYARVPMSGPKKNGIFGRLRHQPVFMTLEF